MYSKNISVWQLFPGLTNSTEGQDPQAEVVSDSVWEETVGGAVGVLVFLIAVVIAVRRNLELVSRLVGQIQSLLTSITGAVRPTRSANDSLPASPPRTEPPVCRVPNLTDAQLIEMRTFRISSTDVNGGVHLYAIANDRSYV